MSNAPNFRGGICCATCRFYAHDYEGDGHCKKFKITKIDEWSESNYARWDDLCDAWEEEA